MKAFLLAAGNGSRLRPITDTIPKCLLRFGGQTLLDRWLDELESSGIDEVLVNLHHLSGAVEDHLVRRAGGPVVRTSYEPTLLGSAGTLLAHREWVAEDEMFVACNADNLTDFRVERLIDFHRAGDSLATLAVFRADDPSACGIVEVDDVANVSGYAEKPAHPRGDLANAGIYAFDPAVLGLLNGRLPLDVGFDLLPQLVGHARAVEVGGYFRDIGTVAAYQRAQDDWQVEVAR
jgi:mannose-1-phosphate guanylyltransferase